MFQHYALFRHMSVADNVEFALRVRRMRRADRLTRRQELLKLVALEGMDERLPTQLSGGQQQRVAVARALAHRPEVLLLDEPFGALDAKIREELRRTIRRIQQELGVTTILVTHDQDEAFAMADRIGVMHQGRLLEVGSPDELYARPAHALRGDLPRRRQPPARLPHAATTFVSSRPGAENVTPREIVAVIRPEEVELTTGEAPDGLTPVGTGVVQELQFAGATERLRVRMPMEGPVPATPDREGADGGGWLLDATRTFPEQRANPLAIGQKVTVSARRIHSLPTPISSFTVIAREQASAEQLRDTPLLATLAARMQTRITMRTTRTAKRAARHAGARRRRRRQRDRAVEPRARRVAAPRAAAGRRGPDAHRRAAGRARPASARSASPRACCATSPPNPCCSRSTSRRRPIASAHRACGSCSTHAPRALTEHGLDLRTELRFGDPDEELARELAVDPNSMLVLGLDSLDGIGRRTPADTCSRDRSRGRS